jgi:Tfp pilus assembly protein PilF
LLQLAIATAKQGNRQGARVLLQQVLDADKHNDRAWLWMAYTSTNLVDRRRYLRTVLRLNPNNKAAQSALAKMQQQRVNVETRTKQYGIIALALLVLVVAVACLLIVLLQ